MSTAVKFTAGDMVAALHDRFCPEWAALTEVTARAQYMIPAPRQAPDMLPIPVSPAPAQRDRRIDVLLLRPGFGGIERLAIEIKVSRQDFFTDVAAPGKQEPWRKLAHRHAYAVPAGLVTPADVPPESGLLVVTRYRTGRTGVTWARRASRPVGHDPGQLPTPILMDAFRRASNAEAQLRGYGHHPEERA